VVAVVVVVVVVVVAVAVVVVVVEEEEEEEVSGASLPMDSGGPSSQYTDHKYCNDVPLVA